MSEIAPLRAVRYGRVYFYATLTVVQKIATVVQKIALTAIIDQVHNSSNVCARARGTKPPFGPGLTVSDRSEAAYSVTRGSEQA